MNVSNVTPVSSGVNMPAPNVDAGAAVNPATTVADSEASDNKDVAIGKDPNVEQPGMKAGPEPLKGMSTSDFLTLHNANYESTNVMDKLLKMLETIIALKVLEDTLEGINKENNRTSFKGIA